MGLLQECSTLYMLNVETKCLRVKSTLIAFNSSAKMNEGVQLSGRSTPDGLHTERGDVDRRDLASPYPRNAH